MEPITVLLLAAVITKMITTHKEDMEYARHGQDSPRYRLKMARWEAGQGNGDTTVKAPTRPGMKGYLNDLWDDCWDDLGEYRKRSRKARKDGSKPTVREERADAAGWSKRSLNKRPDGRPVDDMLDVAGVRTGQPEQGGQIPTPPPVARPVAPTAPKQAPFPPPTADGHLDRLNAELAERRTRRSDSEEALTSCEWCGTNVHAGHRVPRAINGVTHQVDQACAETIDNARERGVTPVKPFRAAADPNVGCDVCGQHRNAPWCNHRKAAYEQLQQNAAAAFSRQETEDRWIADAKKSHLSDDEAAFMAAFAARARGESADEDTNDVTDEQQLAPVIPLFPTTKEITMANSEATGLPTAIAYAEAAAQAHDTFATAGSEGYVNALVGFELGDESIGSAREAQEASTNAAAKWAAHAEVLKKQQTGREFYQSNPDAGNKQFLTGE